MFMIISLGSKAGAFYITLFILSSIFLSVTQPAVGLSFSGYSAGKALTSFNLLIFAGTFVMQWLMGFVIDIVKSLGHSEIFAFKSAFSFIDTYLVVLMLYLLTISFSYKPHYKITTNSCNFYIRFVIW